MTKELNSTQRDQLTAQFAELVVDNMDTKDLVRYAISGMIVSSWLIVLFDNVPRFNIQS